MSRLTDAGLKYLRGEAEKAYSNAKVNCRVATVTLLAATEELAALRAENATLRHVAESVRQVTIKPAPIEEFVRDFKNYIEKDDE
jgi:hypothetical protein